jgi:two-component system NarL family response regulator
VTIRLVIAEGQRLVRGLMAILLGAEADMVVAGEAGSGEEALRIVHAAHPDVLLLDIDLADAMAVVRKLRNARSPCKLIALTFHNEPRIVREMLRIGVSGYLVKSAALGELRYTIRAVMEGRTYLSPEIVYAATAAPTPERLHHLAPREREVLALIADGRHSIEIAARLGISAATVDVYRRNITRKLDLYTIPELTKYAIRTGLTSL